MQRRALKFGPVLLAAAALFIAAPLYAQSSAPTGKLKIHVSPKQAYVFVDGKAIRDGSQTIQLSAGMHEVGVYNYGYAPNTQQVTINAGKTTAMDVTLASNGAQVSGPFGEVELKGDPRAAVLLNGATPAFFVGHVDEFNWDWIWHQRLLLHPGTYQLTATREGQTIWSGPVTVTAGKHITVYLDQNGRTKTQNWAQGETIGPQPRFMAGIASATVPVAPVTAQLALQPTQAGCGQPATLDWNASNAASTSITNIGPVPEDGSRTIDSTQNTVFELTATGPGGTVTKSVTLNVQGQPAASLSLSTPVIHFHKVGDKVVEDDPATLSWTASDGAHVTITPLGSEIPDGARTMHVQPQQTADGPVNEDVTYTLTASNACGATVSRTATLHIVGSIDPAPSITVASLFYPTDYPTRRHPRLGLLPSEKQMLADAATQFKKFEQYNQNASLTIVGHADVRGSSRFNEGLSERRAQLVREYLISQGIPANRIVVQAEGKNQQLSREQVQELQAKDPQKPEKWMTHSARATWLAYNRRVDVLLEPAGQHSIEEFPNDAAHARLLWEIKAPSLKSMEKTTQTSGVVQQASASTAGD